MRKSQLLFSKSRLQGLPVPSKGRAYHYDQKTAGLCIAVMPSGRKVFYSYRWIDGTPTRIRIGGFPDITVETARKQATAINARIAAGENPQAEKREARRELTLGALWEHWLENYAKPYKKTWGQDESMWRCSLRHWRNRRLSAISPGDVQRLHSKIGRESGRPRANRVIAMLRAMFTRAGRELGYTGPNPAENVTRFREVSRDRFLTPTEIPRLLQAVMEEKPINRDAILLALFTGARKANVLAMRWEDTDLDRGVWRIPETKNGRPVIVPLAIPALEILKRRRVYAKGPWVLPSYGKSGHLEQIKFAWQRVCERAGFEDVRFHDLRRTLGSWQASTGASLPVIGKSLGHTSLSATQIYAQLSLDPVRESVEKATAAMLAAGGMLQVEGPKDE